MNSGKMKINLLPFFLLLIIIIIRKWAHIYTYTHTHTHVHWISQKKTPHVYVEKAGGKWISEYCIILGLISKWCLFLYYTNIRSILSTITRTFSWNMSQHSRRIFISHYVVCIHIYNIIVVSSLLYILYVYFQLYLYPSK